MDIERNNMLAKYAYSSYPGWKCLIEPLVDICNASGISIMQIKEKFGSLRFYTSGDSLELQSAYKASESQSGHLCPSCGKDGQEIRNRNGYWTSLCTDCYVGRNNETITTD